MLSNFFLFVFLTLSTANTKPPKRIIIEPRSIQIKNTPVSIQVHGVPSGKTVLLEVAKDCAVNTDFDRDCNLQIIRQRSSPAVNGIVHDKVNLDDLHLPEGVLLRLRARYPDSKQGAMVVFGIGVEPCSWFRTIGDTFGGGECDLEPAQVFQSPPRGNSTIFERFFEVAVLGGEQLSETIIIPKSARATGVTWQDNDTLLFTVSDYGKGGLYTFTLGDEHPKRMMVDKSPRAPFFFGDKRFGLIHHDRKETRLIMSGRKETVLLPLPFDQILARSRSDGETLLAMSHGFSDGKPGFFTIDLRSRQVLEIGFSDNLYQEIMRRPGQASFLCQKMNPNRDDSSWIELREKGQGVKMLTRKVGRHAILPCWSPDGRRVAYLSERVKPR